MKKCPHCTLPLVKSPVETGLLTCMNLSCSAVYVVNSKTNEVITDSSVV